MRVRKAGNAEKKALPACWRFCENPDNRKRISVILEDPDD
jgi:hypothetical protein